MFRKRKQMGRIIGEYLVEKTMREKTEGYNMALAKSNEILAEKIEAATKADIEARDRVDISLEEYNHMKNQIRKLEVENGRLKTLLEKIRFPFSLNVVPDTISTCYCHDPMDFMVNVEIRFKVNDLDLRNAVRNGEIPI